MQLRPQRRDIQSVNVQSVNVQSVNVQSVNVVLIIPVPKYIPFALRRYVVNPLQNDVRSNAIRGNFGHPQSVGIANIANVVRIAPLLTYSS